MDLEDSSWKSATSPRRLVHKPPLKGVTPHGVGRCPQGRGDRSVRGGPPLGGGGVPPQSVTSSAAMSKPSGGIRSLHSLSACGLPTPIVALACIGNVDIQVFSCADGEPYFLRRFASLHIASPERGGEPPLGGGGVPPQSVTSSAAMSKPSGGIRSFPSLSACGLPTPIVALACIGNVDIQVFSCADGEPYFLRRFASLHIASPERGGEPPLGGGGVSPCIIRYSSQPISQRVTLLFFFTEKKK